MTRRIVVIISLFVLFGCQKFLDIVLDDNQTLHPRFRFYYALRPHIRKLSVRVRLREFAVFRRDGNYQAIVWEIDAPSEPPFDKAATVDLVEYGVCPEGFRTKIHPKPLEYGVAYQATAGLSVKGDHVAGAGGLFKLKGPAEIESKQ